MRSWLFIGSLLGSIFTYAQEDPSRNWTLNGYVKQLNSVIDINAFPTYLTDQLIHNRLNFRWFPNEHWTVRLEMRNRIFYGDLVKLNDSYADQIEMANNDVLDASWHWIDRPGTVINSTMDRFYVQYNNGNFESRLGRQRINWGINSIWNPNDIFNAFAFTDFDYEERPGSDALLLRYYTGVTSSVEFAINGAPTWDDRVMAGLVKWNRSGYDFQLLSGVAEQSWVIGAGWAGNIGKIGFKGEWTYFLPFQTHLERSSFALTIGLEYTFENSLFLSSGYLYNSNGRTQGSLSEIFNFELSAKNLYPFRHAIALSGAYPISPLVNSSLTFIYSPLSVHPLFVNPGLIISVGQNWDLDIIGQIAFNREGGEYVRSVMAGFLRIKFSF